MPNALKRRGLRVGFVSAGGRHRRESGEADAITRRENETPKNAQSRTGNPSGTESSTSGCGADVSGYVSGVGAGLVAGAAFTAVRESGT